MVEIYGQSGYNETSNTFLLYNKIRYLTASGIPILIMEGESTHIGIVSKSIVASQYTRDLRKKGKERHVQFSGFIHNRKLCRVRWDGYVWGGELERKVGRKYNDELNIETYQSLTDSQRKVILDIIEVSGLSPNKIHIDDNSDEQLVKKQLRLHSVVSQFHR
jgi:hypothetical protein